MAYHLLGPKVWLREGRIRPVLDNCHTAFPQIPETLFAILWSVGGSRAPNFSSFLTFGLLLALSGSIAIRCGLGDVEAWWVAAIVSTMPAVYTGAHGCFVDATFAAFVIAATRVGLDAQNSSEWSILGLFCGLALGTKYTALLAVPAVLMCVLLLPLKRRSWNAPALAKKIFLAGGIAFLIGSPYYIRNWLVLGCRDLSAPTWLRRMVFTQVSDPRFNFTVPRLHTATRDWIGPRVLCVPTSTFQYYVSHIEFPWSWWHRSLSPRSWSNWTLVLSQRPCGQVLGRLVSCSYCSLVCYTTGVPFSNPCVCL